MKAEQGGPEFVGQDGAGVPDALQRLWTPHRMAYIKGQDKPEGDEPPGCPFCRLPSLGDEQALIVARGETVYAVLNLYPYNPGHLMVVPYRHVADYPELTPAETRELAELTQHAMLVVRAVSAAHGFNIGMNQGVIAGAGIAAHLHQHLVPRWGGDANFMPVIGHTKVLPQLLGETRRLLADAWEVPPGTGAGSRQRWSSARDQPGE
ncbi:ATP adenylyltransferase [Amycolatopsis sulphurea]|uniref:ATP adenylyltransferase n=1 Tax=Amycolatopsis sulphurea TaxID=76022 RepID=A0A2A9G2J0_9PSEU|nr:HIT domain-containing protein [Amycolatopsis sulphurea]PFG57020.1 ATP adenylyltransferase [Amycolatopsis sulphurea]